MTLPVRLCGICSKPVTETDHYKELDCTFPKCPGDCYHDDCMDPWLRKRGRQGTEQRTKYPCPATLANGQHCPGTIRATHNRQPMNQKKKELAREAAVVVASNRQTPPAAAAAGSDNLTAKPQAAAKAPASGGLKILNKGAAIRAGGVRAVNAAAPAQPVRNAWAASPWGAATKIDNNTSNGAAALDGPMQSAAAKAPKPANLLAPEPVVRQRIIPGWSGPEPPAGKASLEQQRAVAAALKAEARGAAGRGGGRQAGAAAAAQNGARPAATPEPAEGAAATRAGRDSPTAAAAAAAAATAQVHVLAPATPAVSHEPRAAQPPGGTTAPAAAAALQPGGGGGGQHLDAAAFDAAFRAALSRAGHAVPAVADSPHGEVGRSGPGSADGGDGNALSSMDDGADGGQPDPDPVVAFDPVFTTEDGGTMLVQDVHGNFLRVDDVYGADAEYGEFPDEYGNLVYGVAIRQSRAESLAAAPSLPPTAAPSLAITPAPSMGPDVMLDQGHAAVAALLQLNVTPPAAPPVGLAGAASGLLGAASLPLSVSFPLPVVAAAGAVGGGGAAVGCVDGVAGQAAEAEEGDAAELEDLLALLGVGAS